MTYSERELEIAYCVGLMGQKGITVDKLSEDLKTAQETIDKLKEMLLDLRHETIYCDCEFVMIMRDQESQRAYCSECKKEVIE